MELLRTVESIMVAVDRVEGDGAQEIVKRAGIKLRECLTKRITEKEYNEYLDGLSTKEEKLLTGSVDYFGNRTSWLAILREVIEIEKRGGGSSY